MSFEVALHTTRADGESWMLHWGERDRLVYLGTFSDMMHWLAETVPSVCFSRVTIDMTDQVDAPPSTDCDRPRVVDQARRDAYRWGYRSPDQENPYSGRTALWFEAGAAAARIGLRSAFPVPSVYCGEDTE